MEMWDIYDADKKKTGRLMKKNETADRKNNEAK